MITLRLSKPVYVLFLRNLTIFLNQFVMQTFEALVQPVLYLLCFGYVMGAWFDITAVTSYSEFVFLGILIAIPMSVASYEANYTYLEYLSKKDFYKFLNILPIKRSDVLIASFLWSVFKSIIIMSFFLFIGTALGLVTIYSYLEAMVLGGFVAIFFSALTLLLAIKLNWQRGDFHKILYMLIPLFLFSGTFFPVETLPPVLRHIALYNPLGYSMHIMRSSSFTAMTLIEASILCTFLLLGGLLLLVSLRLQRLHPYNPR